MVTKYNYHRHELTFSNDEEVILQETMKYKKLGVSKTIKSILKEYVEAIRRKEANRKKVSDNRSSLEQLGDFLKLRY